MTIKLNSAQKEAVEHLSSPLLVVAGAGSGKTGVITQKIAYLIEKAGYSARNVFALTFTNKAAREMEARSKKILGSKAKGLTICTFHSLGLEFLRNEVEFSGFRKSFNIFDTKDCEKLIAELSKSDDGTFIENLKAQISNYKNAGIEPEVAIDLADNDNSRLASQIYSEYQRRLRAYNGVDFDDLLLIPCRILSENREVREKWQHKINYLLVDEYQDTNDCQYRLLQYLTGSKAAFTAVGDDDQSIYAWRGANPQNIELLRDDYPNLKIIKLEQNYRCHQKILTAANAVIAQNPHIVEKKLWSDLSIGEGIKVMELVSEESEAEEIASDIYQKIMLKNCNPSDFAVLYRSNFQARIFEEALRDKNLPYKVSGGTSFFEHNEIRDLIAFLRLINNPADDAAFLRICNVPKRNIGTNSLEKLSEFAARKGICLLSASESEAMSVALERITDKSLKEFAAWIGSCMHYSWSQSPVKVLEKVIEDIEYFYYLEELYPNAKRLKRRKERVEHLKAWIASLEERFPELDKLMQHFMLLDILEHQDKNTDSIQLMSLHAAKGLEFKNVYIAGVEEDLLPHANSLIEGGTVEEERRLFYVGMTRAKENLTITYAKKRKRRGKAEATRRSRFLDELPKEGVNWVDGSIIPENFFADLKTMLTASKN